MFSTLGDVDRSLTVMAASLLVGAAGSMFVALRTLAAQADVQGLVWSLLAFLAGAAALRLLQPAEDES